MLEFVYLLSMKEDKASGGCHRIGKEFFVQAQSRFWTQLCRGIIDRKEIEDDAIRSKGIIEYL